MPKIHWTIEYEVKGMANRFTHILRAPHQVSFDITNKCNLRCLHCFNSSGENDVVKNELSDEEVLSFIRSLVPMQLYNVCFCGGETLIRKDLLCKCIKELKPSGTHCSMVTNGILATDETIMELEQTGLDAIQFSLDGMEAAHDKLRNKTGVYASVMRAIHFVINNTNLHLSIAFTPTNFNLDDFEIVYEELAQIWKNSKRVKTGDYIELRLQPLMLLGRAKNNLGIVPTDDQYRRLVQLIREREAYRYSKSIDVKWGDPIDHLIRFKDNNNFLDQAIVHANGDIVVSAYLPIVVGNINKHSLSDYWNHGLNDIWSKRVIQYLVSRMQSIHDMEELTDTIADINMDNGLSFDLMECDLDDLNLIKEVLLS